jgi:hypothetical protein
MDAFATAEGTELSSIDVGPTWFTSAAGALPTPPRPLTGSVATYVSLPRDEHWSIPTITDDLDEPDEHVRLRVATFPEEGRPLGEELGSVPSFVMAQSAIGTGNETSTRWASRISEARQFGAPLMPHVQ